MKMCLAPCFKGCTDEAYAAEVDRVQAWFDSRGESLLHQLEAERDQLSAAMEFEAAAQLHVKVAKVKSIISGSDEICRRLDRMDAVIVQPSGEHNSVALFRFREGAFAGPAQFLVEHEAEPIEARLRTASEQLRPARPRSASQFTEELGLLKRWYYRTHKTGEIIFANQQGDLSIRKLANAITRVHRGEKAPVVAVEHKPESPPQTSGFSEK
jgi:excinuclease ABC subunit C